MQKIAFLIAVLSLGAGCASQGSARVSSSRDRYPSMTSESTGIYRDAFDRIVIQTPSTSSQLDPGVPSAISADSGLDKQDMDISASMEADRSLDTKVDLSASGGPAGSDSGRSFRAESTVNNVPINDPDQSSSGNDEPNGRADFEAAVATDSVDEALGRPASTETDSAASGSLQIGDSQVQVNTDVDRRATVDRDTRTDVEVAPDSSDIKANSSIRGGSDRVRNVPLRHMDTETARNYTEKGEIKADSSVRGGSDRVRGIELRRMETETPRSFRDQNRIKADSSVRGASAQARGTDRLWMSGNNPADVPMGRVTSNEPDWMHKMNPAQGTPPPAQTGRSSAFAPAATGASLADRVKKSLVKENSETSGMLSHDIARNIKVSNNNGTIVLTGSVPSEKTSRLIEIRAGAVPGVTKVENQLTINRESLPAERDNDASLQSEAQQ